ncbi:MAG: glycoside hydrolase family 172 protein [Thermoguttaceae bacterium]
MTFRCLLLSFALLLPCGIAQSQTPSGNPLSGLERLKTFETMRASSSDAKWQNGNDDWQPIAAGKTLTLADLKGPGLITHLWLTIDHEAPFYSRLLTLRIYWDGEEHPSVECPIGDFFGIGHGVDQSFTSLPIRVTSNGRARNCYWPMPFRRSARITVTNDSDKRCKSFYYYVDWQKHEKIADDAAYFHAMYRQEYPCVMGRDYLLADIQGRGHYVGTIQSVYHSSPGWYGEGDDFFFIDGEKEPSLRGTGTEDYFCNAWGFEQQAGPYYGTPLWEGFETGDRGTAYRFHVADPVTFKKSLRVEIEHKGSQVFPDGKVDGFIERDDLMSSVALWYQTEPHKPWPALPAGKHRLPFYDTVLVKGWEVEKTARHSTAPFAIQPLGGTTDGKQVLMQSSDPKGWIETTFKLDKTQTLDLSCRLTHSWDYGVYSVLLDGKRLGQFDLYSPSVTPATHHLGVRKLASGTHTLRLECIGKSPASKSYFLGFDALTARVPVYARDPSIDLRTLQKKK